MFVRLTAGGQARSGWVQAWREALGIYGDRVEQPVLSVGSLRTVRLGPSGGERAGSGRGPCLKGGWGKAEVLSKCVWEVVYWYDPRVGSQTASGRGRWTKGGARLRSCQYLGGTELLRPLGRLSGSVWTGSSPVGTSGDIWGALGVSGRVSSCFWGSLRQLGRQCMNVIMGRKGSWPHLGNKAAALTIKMGPVTWRGRRSTCGLWKLGICL